MRRLFALLLLLAVVAPAEARPKTGRVIRCQDWKPAVRWLNSVYVDPRCALLVPVNVVRIYSDQHSAEQIAPRKWLNAQFQIANWLYMFPETEMRQYGGTRKAPCLQFKIHKIHDVHERDVGAALGYKFDTEMVVGAGQQKHNGRRISGTQDLRQLKVSDNANMLTVFCVWALKNPSHLAQELGGESNIGFTSAMPTGPRRVLRRVIAERARMGVVAARQAASWMNTVAHEFGHYFGLWHAWERPQNIRNGLTDMGQWVQGKVDAAADHGNCMDYDNGKQVRQYFARSQLNFMYKFARDKASTKIKVIDRSGTSVRPDPVVRSKLRAVWKELRVSATPGGPVKVEGDFTIHGAKGKKGSFIVWFNDRSGQKLRDNDKKFSTVDGQVAAWREITPGFDGAGYTKFAVELPAGQLHLQPGTHRLQANAGVVIDGKVLATSKWSLFSYTVPGRTRKPAGRVAAWITRAKVTPGHVFKGVRWLKIETDVTIDNLVGQAVWLEARYFLSDGRQLKDFDKKYAFKGFAYANKKVVPKLPRSSMTKVEVWIPESELHLIRGVFRLYATITVRHGTRNLTSSSTPVFSVGTKTKTARPPVANVTGNIESVWVTHNHTEGGKTGLRVHARFSVNGSKGRKINIVAWFWNSKAKRLKDFDGTFKTSDGQVSVAKKFTPLYPNTRFSDAWLFIPYAELHLARGTHRLGVTLGVYSGSKRIVGKNSLTLFTATQR